MQLTALSKLTDDAVLEHVHSLVAASHHTTAELITFLGEVEERRLHLKAGASSLFDFCVTRLGMSEGEAFRRMTAARLARRFPVVVELIASGAVHLSALVLLRDHLTLENHRELFQRASRKTKREVELLIRTLAPKPDAPSQIRKLPARAAQAPAASPAIPVLEPPPAPLEAPLPKQQQRVEVLSPERHKVQFTASTELRDKLELALDLMSHANPSRDLAAVVERALDLLLAELEKKKFGKTERPRAARPSRSGRVSNQVRRAAVARDGQQCSYVSPDGQRCTARAFLEFDHAQARALGGGSGADNIRLRCRAHNHLGAEEDFGKDLVEHKIHLRQRKSGDDETTGRGSSPSNRRASTESAARTLLHPGAER